MKATHVFGTFSTLRAGASETAADANVRFLGGRDPPHRISSNSPLFSLGLNVAALFLLFIVLLMPQNSQAQDGAGLTSNSNVFRLGDVAVSGFSGVKLQTEGLPPGINPISKTVIDPEGTSLRIFDGSLASVPFVGQQFALPLRKDVKAEDIGQVFALAVDRLPADERGSPRLFAGATSAFGINIVGPDQDGDGLPDRLSTGAPGAAFMDGQFGPAPGGGAGAIWRVDAITGELGLYAELANSGPGLGGLAFDPVSRTIYASDLDTGLIHHFSGSEVGLDVSQFDHGLQARPFGGKTGVADDARLLDISSPEFKTNDPASWGMTQLERRVDAIAVHGGRLFYAAAEGPEIWSVGLSADGNFQSDPQIEFAITLTQPGNVTAITFDGEGRMLVAVRNAAQNNGDFAALVAAGPTDVMRFSPESPDDPQTPYTWLPDPEFYPVGNSPERRDASGGLALQYAYKPDGSVDLTSCNGTLLASGDSLGQDLAVHGLQVGTANQFLPAPGQGVAADFVALSQQNSVEARGHAGGVVALMSCDSGSGFPELAEGGPQFPGLAEGGTPGFPGVEGGGGGGGNFPDVVNGGGGGKFPDVEKGGGGKTKQGPFTIEKIGKSASCDESTPCTWDIKVTNDTDQPIPGPVTLQDVISIGDTPTTQVKMVGAPTAPWTCVSSAVPGMSCTHPGPFPPKTSIPLSITFQPLAGSLGASKEIKNCVVLEAAPQQKGGVPAPTSTDTGGMKAILEPLLETCSPKSGICTWSLGILETGGNDNFFGEAKAVFTFTGNDNKPIKSEFSSFTKNIFKTCQTEGSQTVCTGTVGLSKGGFGSQVLDFKVDPSKGPPGSFVTATADVTVVDKGKTLSSKATASTLLATSDVEPLRLGQNFGTNSGKDIKVEMIPNTACTPGAVCDWEMKLTNPTAATISGELDAIFSADLGMTPFNNPKLVEKFEVLINPPDTVCAPEPNQALMVRCKNKAITLAPGATMSLKPSFRIEPVGLSQPVFFDINGSAFISKTDPQGARTTITGTSRIFVRVPAANGAQNANAPANDAAKGDGVQPGAADPAVPPAPACASIPVKNPDGPVAEGPKDGAPAKAANGLEVTKRIVPGACTAESCVFQIAIKNTTKSEVPGPITFTDTLAGVVGEDVKTFKASILSGPDAPWNCAPRADGPTSFLCSHPDPLAAGAVLTATMKMTLNDATTSETLANCAVLDKDAGSCATAPLKQKPQPSTAGQLSLVKTAKACNPARFLCEFEMTVTNNGDAEFKGPVKFSDAATAEGKAVEIERTTVNKQPSAWTCTKGGSGFNCSAELTLAPKASQTVPILTHFDPKFTSKEVRNCATLDGAKAPSCVTIPFQAAVAASKLVFAKNPSVEQCSDGGGGCEFTISITNPGPEEFTGPLEFTDTPTKPDGSQFLNLTLESVSPIVPEGAVAPISCNRVGEGFTCGTGPVVKAKLPAGKTIRVKMSFKPGPGTGATAIKNCAAMTGVEGKPCATIPLVNGPLLRAEKITAANTCVPFCAFAINLKNVGNGDAIGPFVLEDKFTPADANVVFEEIDGAFNCGKAGNGKFVCISGANTLRPGESIGGRVKITGVTPAPEYTNCIDYDPAANAKPSPFDTAFPGRCVTIKDTAPKRPNLVIKKLAPNAEGAGEGHCDLKNSCRFQITVTNNGTGDYVGPLEITDSVSLGVPQFISIGPGSSPAFKWECTKAQNGAGGIAAFTSISCKLPSLTMAPGTSVSLEVAVTAGTTWKVSNRLQNCVEIVRTADFGDLGPDKKSCAFVKLDPFAVKVTKTGDQTCEPGSDCHFRISLFNPGPIDHVAPVTITDQLTGLSSAQIVSITPASAADPFPCVPAPTQIPFTCTSPGDYPLMLGPDGEPEPAKIFDMVVRLPNDASAGQFSNCASASDGTGQASEQSCATVTTIPAMRLKPIAKTAVSASCNETDPCEFKVTIKNTLGLVMPGPIVIDDLTTIGGVPSTQIALKGGAAAPWSCIVSAAAGMQCSYPGPLAVNASVDLTLVLQPLPGSLGTAAEVENCATLQGIRPGFATDCASIPVKIAIPTLPKACFGDMVLTNGICVCPAGTKWNGKICDGTGGLNMSAPIPDTPEPVNAKVCPADRPLGTYPNCCPRGTVFSKGKCVLLKAKPVICGNNQVLDKAANKCVAVKAKPVVCGNNQILDKKTNKCVRRKKTAEVCPADRPVGNYPNCCPEGTEFRNGKCRPPRQEQEKFCDGDRPNGIYPNCCPDGYQYARGKCRRIQQEQQPDQNEGQTPDSKTCPDGSVVYGKYTQCPDDKPVLRDCGEGYRVLQKPNKYGAYCELIPVPGPVEAPQPRCNGNQELGDDGQCYDKVR